MQTNQQPRLILRFDIDTVTCMRRGVPRLLDIGKKQDVRFTFFANMGRAVSYPALIRRRLQNIQDTQLLIPAKKLTSLQKLGLRDWLITVVLNPRVGLNTPVLLRAIIEEGHDLGLHGGANHGTWHHESKGWSRQKLQSEIEWGLLAMRTAGLPRPKTFASPGFTSPEQLTEVLEDLTFEMMADSHVYGRSALGLKKAATVLKNVNTGLLGEPGGVGCLEHWTASKLSRSEVKDRLKPCFDTGHDFILYDHPAFIASVDSSLLNFVIDRWRNWGGQITPLSQLG